MTNPNPPDDAQYRSRMPGDIRNTAASLLSAALALPGLTSGVALMAVASAPTAHAESAPDQGTIDLKYLYYRDYQDGGSRMRISAPSIHLLLPLQNQFALEGSFVADSISGASPLFHDSLSGASGLGVNDLRKAGDLKLTRYLSRGAIGIGFAYSTEHDYVSRAFSLDARIASESNNTTFAFGIGYASDDIDSVNFVARGRSKRTTDLLIGITQVLSPQDIVQSNVTYAEGRGYYDDPYKAIDIRPDHRDQLAWLTRWNHHLPAIDATLRLSARYYRDTFGVRAITLGTEWVQQVGSWSVTPSLRYYTQSAADFYYGPPFPSGFVPGQPYSADQRLSSFGAFTPGIKVAKAFPDGWKVDLKAEYYEQKAGWRTLIGSDNRGRELLPVKAQFYQVGLSKTF